MAIESAADRLAFLSADDFGSAATYAPTGGGSASTVYGIFDDEYVQTDLDAPAPVSGTSPRFTCRTADLTGGGAYDDTLTIGSTVYKVRVIRPDGTGMTTLWLEKQ